MSIFRKRTGQLSDNILLYKAEQRKVLPPYFFLDKKIASFFYLIRYFRTKEGGIFSRILFSILFPLYKYGWYIDLDKENHPIIKKAYNFIV